MDERDKEGNSGTASATQAGRAGYHALEEGYERAREYGERAREYGERSLDYVGQAGQGLTEFVRREPLIAVAGAFLVGYLAAQILRRVSR